MKYCAPYTEIPHRQEICLKTWMPFFKSAGFDTIEFEKSVWKRAGGGKYAEDISVSAHVDDCLITCK